MLYTANYFLTSASEVCVFMLDCPHYTHYWMCFPIIDFGQVKSGASSEERRKLSQKNNILQQRVILLQNYLEHWKKGVEEGKLAENQMSQMSQPRNSSPPVWEFPWSPGISAKQTCTKESPCMTTSPLWSVFLLPQFDSLNKFWGNQQRSMSFIFMQILYSHSF